MFAVVLRAREKKMLASAFQAASPRGAARDSLGRSAAGSEQIVAD